MENTKLAYELENLTEEENQVYNEMMIEHKWLSSEVEKLTNKYLESFPSINKDVLENMVNNSKSIKLIAERQEELESKIYDLMTRNDIREQSNEFER